MSQTKKNYVRKAGRTLLVKVQSDDFDTNVLSFEGLESSYHNEDSQSYFLTFGDVKQSLNALRELRKNHGDSVRVKFAYYRVFFTMENLTDDMDYNTIKTQHRDLVQEQTGGSVLYYKLYRKNDSYLGCGDMTLDTKEAFDQLMSDDGMRNYNLEGGLSGTHYRYRTSNQRNPSANSSVITV
jgi:hypothetical protein